MKKSIEEMLFEAANYADAIVAIAKEHEDDPSFVLLADKCSSVICEAIDELKKIKQRDGRRKAMNEIIKSVFETLALSLATRKEDEKEREDKRNGAR